MKILAMNSARAIWLVSTLFLNPRGRFIVPMIGALAERYGFLKLPQAKDITQPLNMKFEGGSFTAADATPIFVNVSIHDDGIIAETRTSTEESDRFLDDALSWFSAEYGLPHYSKLGIQKIYASELIVQLAFPPNIFNERFSKFANKLARGLSNEPQAPMQPIALHFGPDPQGTKKLAPFRIERLANAPFATNQYYSTAPVPTTEHLELLEALEKAAAS